jgi:large subunit ribosomal protein L15
MELNSLKRSASLVKSRRVGRGGKRGKTSGRGGKGQTARAGNKRRPEWRDAIKKIPKRRGYGKNRSRTVVPYVRVAAVSLSALSRHFADGATVFPGDLVKKGLVRRVSGKIPRVKVLGDALSIKLDLKSMSVSASAKAAIEKAGGSVKLHE